MKIKPQTEAVPNSATWLVVPSLLIACLILSSFLPANAVGEAWYASPALFPFAALTLTALGGLAHLVAWWRQNQAEAGDDNTDAAEDEIDASASDPRLALWAIVMLLVYPAVIATAGFAVATGLFVLAGAWLCNLSVRRALLVGSVLAATLHGVFVVLFKVSLPQPLLWQWLVGGAS